MKTRFIHSVKDQSDLKRQYHKAARAVHPDHGGITSDMQQLNAEAVWWADQLGRKQAQVNSGITNYAPPHSGNAPEHNYFTNQGPVWGSLDPNQVSTFNIDDAIADAIARHMCNLVDSDAKTFITSLVWLVLVVLVLLLFASFVLNGHLFSIGM